MLTDDEATRDGSPEERRRLLAAAYGRDGGGLEPEQAQRLAALLRPAEPEPRVDPDNADPDDAEPDRPVTDEQSEPRRRRHLFPLVAVAAVIAAFGAGWGVHALGSTSAADLVGPSIAESRDAARDALGSGVDPASLHFVGSLESDALWEGRTSDGTQRCFVTVPLADAIGPREPVDIGCEDETAGVSQVLGIGLNASAVSLDASFNAVWRNGSPATLQIAWKDISVTELSPNDLVARTRTLAYASAGGSAIPVAVSGRTSLWAAEHDGLHCVYAITIPAEMATEELTWSAACRDDLVYGEQQTWTFPGPEFEGPDVQPGDLVTTVSWPAGESPITQLHVLE